MITSTKRQRAWRPALANLAALAVVVIGVSAATVIILVRALP